MTEAIQFSDYLVQQVETGRSGRRIALVEDRRHGMWVYIPETQLEYFDFTEHARSLDSFMGLTSELQAVYEALYILNPDKVPAKYRKAIKVDEWRKDFNYL